MDKVIESFINQCDDMMIAEEGAVKNWIEKMKNKTIEKHKARVEKKIQLLADSKAAKSQHYTILCVAQGVITANAQEGKNIEDFFLKEYGIHVHYAECVVTNASKERNEGGGRHDTLFFIDGEDAGKMSEIKSAFGIRWWDDVVEYNDGAYLYSKEILDKYKGC